MPVAPRCQHGVTGRRRWRYVRFMSSWLAANMKDPHRMDRKPEDPGFHAVHVTISADLDQTSDKAAVAAGNRQRQAQEFKGQNAAAECFGARSGDKAGTLSGSFAQGLQEHSPIGIAKKPQQVAVDDVLVETGRDSGTGKSHDHPAATRNVEDQHVDQKRAEIRRTNIAACRQRPIAPPCPPIGE